MFFFLLFKHSNYKRHDNTLVLVWEIVIHIYEVIYIKKIQKKYMSLVLGIQKHWKTYWNITDIILFLEIHVFKEKIWNKEKFCNQEVKIKLN
jgi:hypothetical protein